MALISDRTAEVILMLGNRADIAARVNQWYWNAYVDLGNRYPFTELEVNIPGQWTSNDPTIPIDLTQVRAIKLLTTYDVSGSPTNTDIRTMKDVRAFATSSPGLPAIAARLGSFLYAGPTPDQDYKYDMLIWQKPQQDPTGIAATELLIPDDWLVIADQLAVMYGKVGLQDYNGAGVIRQLMFGDPKNPQQPGMANQKWTTEQAESVYKEFGIKPRVQSYSQK